MANRSWRWPGRIQLSNVILYLPSLRAIELVLLLLLLLLLLLGNGYIETLPFVRKLIQHRRRGRFSRWLWIRWRYHEVRKLVLALVEVRLEVFPVVLILGPVGFACQAAFSAFFRFYSLVSPLAIID